MASEINKLVKESTNLEQTCGELLEWGSKHYPYITESIEQGSTNKIQAFVVNCLHPLNPPYSKEEPPEYEADFYGEILSSGSPKLAENFHSLYPQKLSYSQLEQIIYHANSETFAHFSQNPEFLAKFAEYLNEYIHTSYDPHYIHIGFELAPEEFRKPALILDSLLDADKSTALAHMLLDRCLKDNFDLVALFDSDEENGKMASDQILAKVIRTNDISLIDKAFQLLPQELPTDQIIDYIDSILDRAEDLDSINSAIARLLGLMPETINLSEESYSKLDTIYDEKKGKLTVSNFDQLASIRVN